MEGPITLFMKEAFLLIQMDALTPYMREKIGQSQGKFSFF
jgi:hypothetical protein